MTVIVDDALIRRAAQKLRVAADAADVAETDQRPEMQGSNAVADDFRQVASGLEAALSANRTGGAEEKQTLAQRLGEEAMRTRPLEPPAWVLEIKPLNPPTDGTNGLHRVIGAWPGDETDEEIRVMLEELS